MSSRSGLIKSAPTAGTYIPSSVPVDSKNLSTYINDELLTIGGIINGMLEGGILPPQSKLPKRYKSGMFIYFTQKIEGSEITSAGIWVYLISPSTNIGIWKNLISIS